jgi:ATP-dependent protease HslVU (ClpYQ) peptidase subunit
VTVIAAVVEGGRAWMGGDSAFHDPVTHELSARANQKVFRSGAFLIGVCQSARVLDVLRYEFAPPKHPRGLDAARYMRTLFVTAVRDALKLAGVAKKDDNREEVDAQILVAYRGRLFVIEEDFQVGEPIDDFAAIGSGGDVARGALTVLDRVPPKPRIRAALEAAERYNITVRRPFYVLDDQQR